MKYLRFFLAGAFLASFAAFAADAPEPLEKIVGLRVEVSAEGKLAAIRPTNEALPPALNQAATELAQKLQFRPATREGRPVTSETTLRLTIGFDRNPQGNYSVRLIEADSGPSVRSVVPPRYPALEQKRRIQAIVTLAFTIGADGSVNPADVSMTDYQSTRDSDGNQQRFIAAAKAALVSSRFDVDNVDGVSVEQHARMTYTFCWNRQCGGLGSTAAPDQRLVLTPSNASLRPPSLKEGSVNRPSPGT